MDTKTSLKCKIHNQKCVAINKNPKCDSIERGLCLECLAKKINKNQITLINQAEQEFTDIKQQYKFQINSQSNKNIEILKDLTDNLICLKLHYNSILDKLIGNIKEQIQLIQEDQSKIEQKIEQCSIFHYYSQQIEQIKNKPQIQIRKIIQEQLEKINDTQLLGKCINQLKQIDDQQIQFTNSEQIIESIQPQKEQSTPHLNLTCEEHKKKIIFFDLSGKQSKQNRIACVNCISGQFGLYTSITDAKQLWDDYQSTESSLLMQREKVQEKRIEKSQNYFNLLGQKFNLKITQINEYFNKFRNNRYKTICEKSQILGKDWYTLEKGEILEISDILSKPNSKELLISSIDLQNIEQIQEMDKFIQDSIIFLKEATNQCFKNFGQSESLFTNLTDEEHQVIPNIKELIPDNEIKQKSSIDKKKEVYELIRQDQKQGDKNTCYAIAINQETTTLIASFYKQIRVFEFNNGQIKLRQTLNDHENCVNTLVFMKKSNSFVSGSDDKKIKIWALKFNKVIDEWVCQQTLKDHTNLVNQIIVNRQEDLIISCSDDMTIKFWSVEVTWKCCQIVKDHVGPVLCISLNESQNKLVSCGMDHQILLYQEKEKNWSLQQKIKGYGFRIAFITDFFIAFQPVNSKKMKIYKFSQEENLFIKSQKVKMTKGGPCRYSFPMIYNKDKKILFNKNGRVVHVIKIISDEQLNVEQSINFQVKNGHIFGTASDDGKYLVTWDYFSKEIIIRKYQN